eukprot:scaffold18850_cov103-Isochrysis_galbana.AAC.2
MSEMHRQSCARLALLLLALTPQSCVEALAARPAVGAARPRVDIGQSWPLGRIAFSLLPLAGSDRRKTLQTELVRGRLWTHDQIQGVVNVNVPVRQTVIRLHEGGLWVHNPVAPSGECLRLVRELEAQHGPVKHIVLGTVGLEHKALAGPFSSCFPDATVWVQPGQWSFPLPLPLSAFGFPATSGKLRVLPAPGAADAPSWAANGEIEYEILGPLRFKAVGAFGETAFFHRAWGYTFPQAAGEGVEVKGEVGDWPLHSTSRQVGGGVGILKLGVVQLSGLALDAPDW